MMNPETVKKCIERLKSEPVRTFSRNDDNVLVCYPIIHGLWKSCELILERVGEHQWNVSHYCKGREVEECKSRFMSIRKAIDFFSDIVEYDVFLDRLTGTEWEVPDEIQ